MADIFLSYSREDQTAARRFAEAFERAGFSVWWDTTLSAGENYDEVTEAALRGTDAGETGFTYDATGRVTSRAWPGG